MPFITNIPQQVAALEATIPAQDFANEVLARVDAAICVTDRNGVFLKVNAAYTELYGYSEAELIGQHFTMVLPEEYRAYADKMHQDFIAGTDELPQEWTVMNKAGELIRIAAMAARGKDDQGLPAKITLIERLDA